MNWKWLIAFIFPICFVGAQTPSKPFPQHIQYYKGCIKPNHVSQEQLDKRTIDFYNQWKHRYIKTACHPNEKYVWFELKGNKQCVSEGQGYGMMITALMAGVDPTARETFDNLYHYCQSHQSNHPYLLAWAQDKNCKNLDKSSASDGDMDIAYALLLANKQWGSNGTMNYLQEARYIIAAIMQHEINPHTYAVLLSDAIDNESRDYNDMRSSDFMPSHFKVFEAVTHDKRWKKVIDNNYQLFNHMQNTYSEDAGLIPDFIRHINKKPQPAGAYYLESPYDGYYNYNACRVPWRIATDYLLTGDSRAKNIADKINLWVRQTTNNNPDNISAGYTLAGDDIKGRNFEALSFIGSFATAAMIDKANQHWLNAVWDYLINFKLKDYDYYDNSIKLLNMIILSGNYWDCK